MRVKHTSVCLGGYRRWGIFVALLLLGLWTTIRVSCDLHIIRLPLMTCALDTPGAMDGGAWIRSCGSRVQLPSRLANQMREGKVSFEFDEMKLWTERVGCQSTALVDEAIRKVVTVQRQNSTSSASPEMSNQLLLKLSKHAPYQRCLVLEFGRTPHRDWALILALSESIDGTTSQAGFLTLQLELYATNTSVPSITWETFAGLVNDRRTQLASTATHSFEPVPQWKPGTFLSFSFEELINQAGPCLGSSKHHFLRIRAVEPANTVIQFVPLASRGALNVEGPHILRRDRCPLSPLIHAPKQSGTSLHRTYGRPTVLSESHSYAIRFIAKSSKIDDQLPQGLLECLSGGDAYASFTFRPTNPVFLGADTMVVQYTNAHGCTPDKTPTTPFRGSILLAGDPFLRNWRVLTNANPDSFGEGDTCDRGLSNPRSFGTQRLLASKQMRHPVTGECVSAQVLVDLRPTQQLRGTSVLRLIPLSLRLDVPQHEKNWVHVEGSEVMSRLFDDCLASTLLNCSTDFSSGDCYPSQRIQWRATSTENLENVLKIQAGTNWVRIQDSLFVSVAHSPRLVIQPSGGESYEYTSHLMWWDRAVGSLEISDRFIAEPFHIKRMKGHLELATGCKLAPESGPGWVHVSIGEASCMAKVVAIDMLALRGRLPILSTLQVEALDRSPPMPWEVCPKTQEEIQVSRSKVLQVSSRKRGKLLSDAPHR